MSCGGQPVFEASFPDPAEQAEALLEVCEGNIREAQDIAAINLKYSTYKADRIYWWRVRVLLARQERAAVIERLASNRLKRAARE